MEKDTTFMELGWKKNYWQEGPGKQMPQFTAEDL